MNTGTVLMIAKLVFAAVLDNLEQDCLKVVINIFKKSLCSIRLFRLESRYFFRNYSTK